MWFRIDNRFSAHGELDEPTESGKQNPRAKPISC